MVYQHYHLKDLIATHGKELISLAQDKGVAFYYEAAVAGGIPILLE